MSTLNSLMSSDPEIAKAIEYELSRQQNNVELIASENIVSRHVLEAQGSILTNKYAEGYPGKRYYCGCEYVDEIENICIDRVCKIFNCKFANVQPHSGSQANQAVFLSFLKPGDTILALSLDSGGHLTHGAAPNMSGKWFNCVHYDVDRESQLIDMQQVEDLALKHKPKIIIAGASAYSRLMDFAKFREIADKVGALLMADIAHYAGLIAADLYPSPFPHAHVATSTTHKTLRGPRGGIIMANDQDIIKKINSAVFPGLQGGPLMHVIAAKAVAFKEAMSSDFKQYIKDVIENATVLSDSIKTGGLQVVSDGTDSHIVLVDLRNQGVTGKDVVNNLEVVNITCNKNAVPFDDTSPFITSGIRLGTPAPTTRGFGKDEFKNIGSWICDVVEHTKVGTFNEEVQLRLREKVINLCNKFPMHQ